MVLQVLSEYAVNEIALLNDIDKKVLSMSSRWTRKLFSQWIKGSFSVEYMCSSLYTEAPQGHRNTVDARLCAEREVGRVLRMRCPLCVLHRGFLAYNVNSDVWDFTPRATLETVRVAASTGNVAAFKKITEYKDFDSSQRVDITYFTRAVRSGNVSLTAYMQSQAWRYNEDDIASCVVTSVDMMQWVCSHILTSDLHAYACAANCYAFLGDLISLRNLHDAAVYRDKAHLLLQNPYVQLVQLCANENHLHILRWLATETQYDIEKDIVMFESYLFCIGRGNLDVAKHLHERAPSFLNDSPFNTERLLLYARDSAVREWLTQFR
ncbi:hypothetical protein CYMTET_10813 [Cymbomonas tetramitiformis]|uniref:Uncharacterized protein n=1 Tax=Cymbomonas tetramitiformis TaxID=36881 RepID=A0AAE0GNN4_9CHLO|nr:hypothetical protein CYMTET_10813 [Cymbomonas tetramitiformis]